MRYSYPFIVFYLLSFLSASIHSQERREQNVISTTAVTFQKKAHIGKEYMVVAANPYASWAGKNIIEKGGSAIDAAVAIQAMLTLVEPQSSGIGGGGFILYWDNQAKVLHTYDGRETAPSKAKGNLFIKNGKPEKLADVVSGGRAVGVPGILKALDLAHKDFGVLDWSSLFDDGIALSESGFVVSKRLASLVQNHSHPSLKRFKWSSRYFYPSGKPISEGQTLKNRALAKTLKTIATQGVDGFYKGDIAKNIAKEVRFSDVNPGLLSVSDLANYKAVKRSPVCGSYKAFTICGMAPPSSGGISVLQILRILEPFNISQYPIDSVQANHLLTQASRLAYADRDMYIADSDFSHIPYSALLSK